MNAHTLRRYTLVFPALLLIITSLACSLPTSVPPSEAPATDTPELPGDGETQSPTTEPTVPPSIAPTAAPTDTVMPPNVVITAVTLSTSTPAVGGWVSIDVTVQNQGGAPAESYELVLIPHYGWGPPNPAGFEELPTLAPGATHTSTFSPGVLYPDVGTFTLRVLVTDDWLAIGNPDSTGTAGDVWDETITVLGPNVVITAVTFSTTTPAAGGWVTVNVTIQNQGGAAAESYELVLIPHYGWGPPNPAGFEELATLAPGATHTSSFSPGVLYTDAGTFTLRVLVTDDWLAIGDPDSTGSAGDIWDETITVGGG